MTNEVKETKPVADIEDYELDTKPSLGQGCMSTLRRVPDKLPKIALLILLVELGERFTYFGLSGPIQNYISNAPHNAAGLPGALGKGQSVASALGNFFKFWAYTSTIIGAIVADQFVGKFKAICIACVFYIVGLVILVATASPAAVNSGAGFGGLVTAMVLIGLGTGGIKANVTPMCAEQYTRSSPVVKTLKSGEQVVVDPELTVERLFLWFYFVVNVGALSPLITVNVEAHVAFWLAYLIPLIVIVISAGVFVSGQKKYVMVPPQGSAIVSAIRVASIALREKSFMKAQPSNLRDAGRISKYGFATSEEYTDTYVSEVQKGVKACRVFLFLPFYFVCWIQIWNNLISQAGHMDLGKTPNDLLQNLDPIALIVFIPFLDYVVYPLLRRYKINFTPNARILTGFLLVSLAMAYAAVLQHFIYKSPENSIFVWIQGPAYVLVAFSEAFVIVTGLEIAFTQAPKGIRSFVSALFWLTIGIAAAIGIGLAPVSQDPYMVWTYSSLAIVGFLGGCVFWFSCR